MKKVFLFAVLATIGISTIFISSCAKKECGLGQEGTDCTNANVKFVGTFKGTSTVNTTSVPDQTVSIAVGTGSLSSTTLSIMLEDGATVNATATANTSELILSEQVATNNVANGSITSTYKGTGSISGTTITLSYTMTGTLINTTNSFVGVKQ